MGCGANTAQGFGAEGTKAQALKDHSHSGTRSSPRAPQGLTWTHGEGHRDPYGDSSSPNTFRAARMIRNINPVSPSYLKQRKSSPW